MFTDDRQALWWSLVASSGPGERQAVPEQAVPVMVPGGTGERQAVPVMVPGGWELLLAPERGRQSL